VKAILCHRFGPPDDLVLADVPEPAAGAGEIVAKVAAVGLNFMDTLIIAGKYQAKPPFPFSPGAEFAGVVESVGAGVTAFAPGDRVMGYTNFGAARERLAVAADNISKLTADLDFERAAALTITYGTGYHALKHRARLQPGETLAVLGASGGAGLAAVELGKLMGARVIACASTDDKLAVCRDHGADATINYAREDLRERIKALTDGKGVDVVYDPVGGPYTEPAFRSLAWRGRHLVVGFAAGEIPKLPLNLALLKGASLVGVFWGDFARRQPKEFAQSIRQLGQWYAEGKLKPHVSQTLPLEKAVDALKLMAARQVKGKLVLTVG
jgi:NADPH2:quinone reductase